MPEITTLDKIFYKPSEPAKKVLKEEYARRKKTNPRVSLNSIVDEIIIKSLGTIK